MKTIKKLTKTAVGLATCLALSASSAHAADIGARLYVQGWNPQRPDDPMVSRPLEQGNAISAAIHSGWTAARATVCDGIKDTLSRANAGTKGISFYQINCDMARQGELNLLPAAIEFDAQKKKWVTVPRMNSGRSFVLRFVLPGNYLDVHATTPSLNKEGTVAVWGSAGAVLGAAASTTLPGIVIGGIAGIIGGLFDSEAGIGEWANPQFKINYDLVLDVGFNTTQGLNVNRVVATIANVKVSPANAPASVAKAAIDFSNAVFKTPAFDALVANGIEGRQVEFGKAVASGLNSVNNAIAPYANPVSQYVQLGVWGKNNMVTLAFSPRLPAPMPPKVASVTGLIRMKKNANFSANICPTNISLASQVMVGPRPIVDVEPLQFGTNPVENFGRFHYTGAGRATADSFDCPYALDQLPVGMLNVVWNNTTDPTGGLPGVGAAKKAAGTGLAGGTVLSLRPAGWDTKVTPNPMLTGKDWDAQVVVNPVGSIAKLRIKPEINPGDPYKSRVADAIVTNPIPSLPAIVTKPTTAIQNATPSISAVQPQRSATNVVVATPAQSAATATTAVSKSVIASTVQQRTSLVR